MITEVREWSIGGHDVTAVDRIAAMMAGRAKVLDKAR
jgi:hypothetical protein